MTLTINNAAAKVIDEVRPEPGSRVEVRQDLMEMHAMGPDGRTESNYVSIDDFYSYAESDYLSDVIFSAEMYAWSGAFFAIDDEAKGTGTRTNIDGTEILTDTLKPVSTTKPDALPGFGTLREIVDGCMSDGFNECIVSEDIARLNNVSVGDTIELSGVYAAAKSYDLTITGIYSDFTNEYLNPWMTAFGSFPSQNRRNEIITGWDTLIDAGRETNHGLNMTTECFLKNPDDISKFEAEVRSKGLPVTYNVSINKAAYDKVTGPLSAVFAIILFVLGVTAQKRYLQYPIMTPVHHIKMRRMKKRITSLTTGFKVQKGRRINPPQALPSLPLHPGTADCLRVKQMHNKTP